MCPCLRKQATELIGEAVAHGCPSAGGHRVFGEAVQPGVHAGAVTRCSRGVDPPAERPRAVVVSASTTGVRQMRGIDHGGRAPPTHGCTSICRRVASPLAGGRVVPPRPPDPHPIRGNRSTS